MKRLILIPLAVLMFSLALPLIFNGAGESLCVYAQNDNPCLSQDATISGLQLENLNLLATNDALSLQLTQLAVTPTVTPQAAIPLDQLPEACVLHTVAAGDVPAVLAETFGVDLITLLIVNNLNDFTATQLQIGDVLIIPLEGCPVDQIVPQPTEAPPTPLPTATLEAVAPSLTVSIAAPTAAPTTQQTTFEIPPTMVDSTVMIISVDGVGDLATESVTIRNNGGTIDLTGWFLVDDDGNIFEFPPQQRLFSGSGVTISTREGSNTPIVFFWGLSQPAFEPGDVVILLDALGNVASTYQVP